MSDPPEIILYQIGRGPRAPSMSPYVVKLETFLRMAKLDYKNSHGFKQSSKGKVPWMTYNGEVVEDSQFCIEYLNRKLNIDLNSHLTSEQRVLARAFQKMAEENLYWCMGVCRLEIMDWFVKVTKVPWIFRWFGIRKFRNQLRAQGMGLHSYQEVLHIMEGDLGCLSEYLGNKKFFFGDDPSEIDAALFGQLSQIYWLLPDNEGEKLIRERFANLGEYCERMKEEYWPDWDECITKDGTVTAPK